MRLQLTREAGAAGSDHRILLGCILRSGGPAAVQGKFEGVMMLTREILQRDVTFHRQSPEQKVEYVSNCCAV
jgi:hypothetical protein